MREFRRGENPKGSNNSAATSPQDSGDGRDQLYSQRRAPWIAAALILVLLATLGAAIGAEAMATNDTRQARQVAQTTAVEVSSSLELRIQQVQDLSAAAGAFFIQNPYAPYAKAAGWVRDVQAFNRYPDVQSINEVLFIRSSQLGNFQDFAARNSSQYQAGSNPRQLIPAGRRPFYCLLAFIEGRPGLHQAKVPAGLDLCQSYIAATLLQTRDSSQAVYLAESLGGTPALAIGTPIYRGGTIPPTVGARRAAIVGWIGSQIVPEHLLRDGLNGHRGTALSMHYQKGVTNVTFSAGTAPRHAAVTTFNLNNGWVETLYSAAIPAGIFGYWNSTLLFLGIVLFSLLLALLTFVLGTSRSSGLQLVAERTDQLQHQAMHDSLTGLPNRALILDRISQMLARHRRHQTPGAVLFLDLDNFKDINDTLGHRAGDQLLIEVGARLTSAIRDSDTVGRLGGDEFVVLAEGASLDAGVQVIADRIIDVLSTPFELDGSDLPLHVSASIGIAEGIRSTPEELLQDADIAMYQAKIEGKHRSVRFLPSMQEAVDHNRRLEVGLQGALEAEQFFLVYQPTIDLETGRFTGVEALLRWRQLDGTVTQPNDFIPALEASDLINDVGAWVLASACGQGARWHRQGHRFAVSVNISSKQVERETLVDDVRRALSLSGFDAGSLILELTESTLMRDSTTTANRLRRLKDLGVRIAIDDFGTGYSSLVYLRQFPIDVLKIDRSFIAAIGDSTESAAIVHTLVQLGKLLGIETIAEGVETLDQRSRLEVEKVDTGQGFLFARPMEVRDIDELLGVTDVAGWTVVGPPVVTPLA